MRTLPANNPDAKGPYASANERPTDQDPDEHNPRVRPPMKGDGKRIDVHGAATNSEDQSVFEAAEGEIDRTPQGP